MFLCQALNLTRESGLCQAHSASYKSITRKNQDVKPAYSVDSLKVVIKKRVLKPLFFQKAKLIQFKHVTLTRKVKFFNSGATGSVRPTYLLFFQPALSFLFFGQN